MMTRRCYNKGCPKIDGFVPALLAHPTLLSRHLEYSEMAHTQPPNPQFHQVELTHEHVTKWWSDLNAHDRWEKFHNFRERKYEMLSSFQNKAKRFWQLQQVQTETCSFSEMDTIHIDSLTHLREVLFALKNMQKRTAAVYFKPIGRFFTGIDSFALIPTLPMSFTNKLVVLQIYSGSSGDKEVKKLKDLRVIFEDCNFLGKKDVLNFALVVPFANIKQPVNVKFKGAAVVTADGKTSSNDVEKDCLVRQWKISTTPTYMIAGVAAVSMKGGYVSPSECL